MAPSKRLVAIVAAPLLVAGSVAGFLVAGGSLSEGLGLAPAATNADGLGECTVPAEFSFPSEAQVQSWSGDVAADADGGTVKVQAWFGGVHVAPSDGNTYSVQVAEVDGRDELEPTVEATTDDGTFSLKVLVKHANEREAGPATVSAGLNPDAEAHVKVRVPTKAYEAIKADSAPDMGIVADDNGTDADVHIHPRADVGVESDSQSADRGLSVHGLESSKVDLDAYNRPVGAADVAGGDVHVETHNARAALKGIQADGKVAADSYNGAACVRNAQAGTLHVDTHNGPATAVDAQAEEVSISSYNHAAIGKDLHGVKLQADSHNGPARLDIVPTDDGEAYADSYNSEAKITVATGETYGYDAYAESYNGEATIDLPNAETQEDDDEEDRWDESAHAKTEDFETREIQMTVEVDSHNGDAIVKG